MIHYSIIEYHIENNIEYKIVTLYCGDKFWYKGDVFHREDGPAVEYSDGTKEYWYEGKQIKVSSDE